MVLSLHIATHPPVLPPHSASTTLLRVPNLTNIVAMRDAVERASSRRFGSQELARLAWLWAWDGESLPSEAKEDDNPFIERKAAPAPEVAGLSYTVTTTRTLCPKSGERVHTYGIGIELELQPGETRQVLMGGAEGGLGNRGVGGGVRLISRWTAGGELRESTIRKRLERWVELNGGLLEEPKEESYLPTPSTRDSDRSEIPPIPLLPLPKIPSMLNSSPAAQRLFAASPSAAASSSSSSLSLPPAFATATPKKTTIAGLSDPFEFVEKTPKAAPSTPKASLEERRRAMEERVS
jgi:hypothetical protein